METLIEDLKWRYAVKKYDNTKKITSDIFEKIKEVLQLVPSSNGLQPYKFLIIESQEIRKELRKFSFNQSQITDASHLIVFCSYKKLHETFYDNIIQLNATVRNIPIENLSNYANYLKSGLLHRSEKDTVESNKKQCYIALGQLLQTAAHLRIDASPMEGFEIEKYDEILGLNSQNLTATVVCALGYRSEQDNAQYQQKVRKPQSDLFEVI